MLFIVTGPTNSKEPQTKLIEAPTVDAAAIGAGDVFGIRVDGYSQVVDFRVPNSPREYRYIRTTDNENYEFYRITPMDVIQVNGDGVVTHLTTVVGDQNRT